MGAPINLTVSLDVDAYLARYVGPGDEDGNYTTEPVTLERIVVEQAAAMLVARIDADATKELGRRVRAITDEVIREQITPVVLSTIATPVQPTTTWGEPQGEPTSLRDRIVADARKLLTEKRRSNSRYDGPQSTMVEDFLAAEVKAALTKELKAALDEGKAEVKQALQAKGAELMAEAIAKTAGAAVQS